VRAKHSPPRAFVEFPGKENPSSLVSELFPTALVFRVCFDGHRGPDLKNGHAHGSG
jgi:hypothetical protein